MSLDTDLEDKTASVSLGTELEATTDAMRVGAAHAGTESESASKVEDQVQFPPPPGSSNSIKGWWWAGKHAGLAESITHGQA